MDKNIQKIKPSGIFTNYIYKAIPLAFDESMSYYETLCGILSLLKTQEEVVNNNADLLAELELYVRDYFKNLDVQTEINNKLDQMAESGQLTDIIAQYLGLAGILAYDTKNLMKSATNLTNGSICKTLGDETYNDGKGNFYKIRTVTTIDVIDNINIIAINNSDTLIAELIPNFYIENLSEEIENTKELLQDSLEEEKVGIWGISKTVNNNDHYLYFSFNGKDFYKIGKKLTNIGSDSSSVIEINNTFYYIGNNTYQYSNDLVNWSEPILITESDREVWSSMFYYDESNNKVYCYQSYRYNDNIITNAVGNNTYNFKIICREGTINPDNTINFGDIISITDENNSWYDPYVIKDNTYGLLIAMVNASTCKISIYHMNNTTSLGSEIATTPYAGVEAPQLLTDNNGSILLYLHAYAIGKKSITGLKDELPQVYGVIQLTNQSGLRSSNSLRIYPVKTDKILRHAGLSFCNKKVYSILRKIGIYPTLGYQSSSQIIGNGKNQIIVRKSDTDYSGTYNLINYPQFIYRMSGGQNVEPTINVINIFAEEPLHMMFRNCKLTWGSGTISYSNNKFSNDPIVSGKNQFLADLYYQEDSGNTFTIVD